VVVPCVVDNIGGGHIIQVVAATIVNTGGFEEWWGVVGCTYRVLVELGLSIEFW